MYTSLPLKFQIRDNCVIGYTDFSQLPKKIKKEEEEKKEIKTSGSYSESAKKQLRNYLDKWTYTLTNTETKFSFITLTISSEYKKTVEYYKLLKQFIEKLEYRYKYINWIWKLELQKNGNPHYHIVIDEQIDWKIVRKQWNKLQKMHVDEYQIKMKNKFKNGYYFDSTLKNEKNEVVEEEIQKKRYEKGNKANWRNPNSTDVKTEKNITQVKKYISKYIKKDVEDEQQIQHNFKRWYGTNDRIKQLKYLTLTEAEIDIQTNQLLLKNEEKKIIEDNTVRCIIYSKSAAINYIEKEKETIEENRQTLKIKDRKQNTILIDKDIKQYTKLYTV